MAESALKGAHGDRLRFRLWASFAALFVGALMLAGVGWWGMNRTQQELRAYESEVLPQIARALEIAERISRLAATAPGIAEAPTAQALQANSEIARSLLDEIRRRAALADSHSRLAKRAEPLLDRGQSDITRLGELAQQRLQLRQHLQSRTEQLERLGSDVRRDAASDTVAPLWASLLLAANSSSPMVLGRVEADVEATLAQFGPARMRASSLARELRTLAAGEGGVLALRRQMFDLDSRSDALLAMTRGSTDLLSDLVAADVERLRAATLSRSAQVYRALASGQSGLLLLTGLCLLLALGSALYVHRLVTQVERITHVMSRLAGGDTSSATPATARRDEIGALARTFETFRDNLVAKQALVAELSMQGQLLAAVHQSMTDGLALLDAQDRLVLTNPALTRMMAAHALHAEPGDDVRPLVATLAEQARWRVAGQGEFQSAADAAAWQLAANRHVEIVVARRLYELRRHALADGGSLVVVDDLTERRAMETQLQQAQRLDMLGRLTGGVAHDFNNHLGTIVGTLGLLMARPDVAPAARLQLARAQRSAERATALTRRLLAFARRQALQAEWVPVDSMVEEMADLVEYSAGLNVDVVLDLQSGDAVYLDRSQLENALLNLVINSASAMPAGGRLWLRTRRGSDELVLIEVEDTGCGIPETMLDKVFEPFVTQRHAVGGGPDIGSGEGSGLGLSIVHGFVHQSGGRISITSQVGAGTKVSMHFPVADVRLQNSALTSLAPTDPQSLEPSAVTARRLVLLDDDEAFRDTLADMLRAEGHLVDATAAPAAALKALEAARLPDALLCDVRLADGADGRAFAQAVRARWPALPIGLMSGMPAEALSLPGLPLHWPFALKPLDRVALRRWLNDVLRPEATVP